MGAQDTPTTETETERNERLKEAHEVVLGARARRVRTQVRWDSHTVRNDLALIALDDEITRLTGLPCTKAEHRDVPTMLRELADAWEASS